MSGDVYFFGCWGAVGHHLWVPRHAFASLTEEERIPWALHTLDSGLCHGKRDKYGNTVDSSEEREGRAALHHKDGWTALSWWDRSVDNRYGCNASVIAKGTFTVKEMLALGREHFPSVFQRFAYEIRVDE